MSGPVPLGFLAKGSVSVSDILAYIPQETWDLDVHAIHESVSTPQSNLALSQDQPVGQPVLSHYSLGLPEGVISEWESHLLVDKQLRGSSTSFNPGYIRFSKPVMIRRLWMGMSSDDFSGGAGLSFGAARF